MPGDPTPIQEEPEMSKNLAEQMKEWRHHIHHDPELAFEEVHTSAFVAQLLEEMGLDVHRGIGGTGVVATLKAGDGPSVIGLRADMDAIAMTEKTGLPYASANPVKCTPAAMTAM